MYQIILEHDMSTQTSNTWINHTSKLHNTQLHIVNYMLFVHLNGLILFGNMTVKYLILHL